MSQNRKSKVFSISLKEDELKEVDGYVEKLIEQTGFKVSRNEIIRRATLAHIRFMEDNEKEYKEIFKKVGV